jgi:hypothetical protein
VEAAPEDPRSRPTRRDFIKTSVLAAGASAVSAQSYANISGANERVNVGVIGFGLIGRIHARSFNGLKEARVGAVSETYQPRAEACQELVGNGLKQYRDFRKLLTQGHRCGGGGPSGSRACAPDDDGLPRGEGRVC